MIIHVRDDSEIDLDIQISRTKYPYLHRYHNTQRKKVVFMLTLAPIEGVEYVNKTATIDEETFLKTL